MKKLSSFLVVLLLMSVSFASNAQEYPRGDVDYDGVVNVSDVTSLINYLLTGFWPDEQGDWVDLGLPSGTLWATHNVGASSPEEYGDYFAWGETEPKDNYSWSTYKWAKGGYRSLTKYCTDISYGYNDFVDRKVELDPEDDAAYVNWGPSWRMPTREQYMELCTECTRTFTQMNGVKGFLLTGPNGTTLFFPAAGCRIDGSLENAESSGNYWTRMLYPSKPYYSYDVNFHPESVGYGAFYRCEGLPIRPVRVSRK